MGSHELSKLEQQLSKFWTRYVNVCEIDKREFFAASAVCSLLQCLIQIYGAYCLESEGRWHCFANAQGSAVYPVLYVL